MRMIGSAPATRRRGLQLTVLGLALAGLLAGCYVAPGPPGRGWCYYHPHQC